MPTPLQLHTFAERYAAAWCSQDAASVASRYSPEGSLKVNEAAPAVGRAAITAAAQGFMTAFPDMQVVMDDLEIVGDIQHGRAVFRWTLMGTNRGEGGTGKRVHIRGYEEWRIGGDRLIAESQGHFDAAEYQRQLEHGV